MMQDFSGKTAVVTGGVSGVGKCLCKDLAALGCNVVVVDINSDRIAAVVDEVDRVGSGQTLGLRCDITKEQAVNAAANRIFSELGNVHLLFNNAGVGLGEASRKLWDMPMSDWRWGFDVNVLGVVHGIRAFAPRMLANGEEGIIVNSSSANGGLRSLPNTPIYAATKAAVTSITEVLHQQLLREDGKVRAAVLFPGPHTVNTGILASGENRPDEYLDNDGQRKVAYRSMQDLVAATGLRMQLTEPEEVSAFAIEGIRAGRFWLLPESEHTDKMLMSRAENILARKDPPYEF